LRVGAYRALVANTKKISYAKKLTLWEKKMAKRKIEFVKFPTVEDMFDGVINKGVTAAELKAFYNPSLEKIELLAKLIKTSKTLLHLNISHNKIDDTGAKLIAEALAQSQLQSLYLCNNDISEGGAQFIASALPKTQLKLLKLESKLITKYSAEYFVNALQTSKQLKSLHVGNTALRLEHIPVIELALRKNVRLHTLNIGHIPNHKGESISYSLSRNYDLANYFKQHRINTAAAIAQEAAKKPEFYLPLDVALIIGQFTERAARKTSYEEIIKTLSQTVSEINKKGESRERYHPLMELQRANRTNKTIYLGTYGDWATKVTSPHNEIEAPKTSSSSSKNFFSKLTHSLTHSAAHSASNVKKLVGRISPRNSSHKKNEAPSINIFPQIQEMMVDMINIPAKLLNSELKNLIWDYGDLVRRHSIPTQINCFNKIIAKLGASPECYRPIIVKSYEHTGDKSYQYFDEKYIDKINGTLKIKTTTEAKAKSFGIRCDSSGEIVQINHGPNFEGAILLSPQSTDRGNIGGLCINYSPLSLSGKFLVDTGEGRDEVLIIESTQIPEPATVSSSINHTETSSAVRKTPSGRQ
jgi:hypothetical protein